MAISKVVYGGKTLVDLTADTITADGLVAGQIAHDAAGNAVAGTNPYAKAATDTTVNTQADLIEQIQAALQGKAAGGGIDTSSDTVTPDALVEGYTAHDATGAQITGTNPYQKEQTDAAVASIATAIEGKGVDVPDDAVIGDMAALIGGIDLGVDTSSDTVTAAVLVEGYTAHDAAGNPIVGANPYERTATDTAVNAQADLIAQIQAVLASKVAE